MSRRHAVGDTGRQDELAMQLNAKRESKYTTTDSRVYVNFDQLVALQNQSKDFNFPPAPLVNSVLSGRNPSRLRGRGLNFEELRHYRSGDDIRNMDWKVTNRTRKPHVRVHTEERERQVLLLVDQRQSMFFGSQEKMKSVVATEVAALIAWRMLAADDRVGALVFNDSEDVEIRPQRNRNTVLRLLQQCVAKNHALAAGKTTSATRTRAENQLNHVLSLAQRLCGHDYLIVLISDLSGCDALSVKRIKSLTQHNDVIINSIFDPMEQALPDSQRFIVSDGERQVAVDASQQDLKQKFSEHFASGLNYLRNELESYAVAVIAINTVAPLQTQFRQLNGTHCTARR